MTMMKSTSLGVLIALVGLFEGIAHSQESWILFRTPKPRGSIRILYASDHDNIRYILTDKPTPEQLRRHIDDLANNGVDILAQNVFAKQGVGWFDPEHPDHAHRPGHVDPIDRQQGPPIKIAIDQCHKRGMMFLAKFRMADRHRGGERGLIARRKDLWNKDFGNGAMDYRQDEIRDWVFAIVDEILRRFDVDGFEFNYIRHMNMFPKATAAESHPIMTKFVRRVRQRLEVESKQQGRKLLLGVRVPQTLEECHQLGYDVPTWIKEGLIDYVAPCDFFYPDFNAKYEEFAALTRSSDCLLFPTVHPLLCRTDDVGLMRPENYRAAVRNMYAAGADGISQFNYMYHWVRRFHSRYPGPQSGYPTALAWLRQMRRPEGFDFLPRHYLFLPLWPRNPPSGFHKRDSIVLKRTMGSSGKYHFRIAENLTRPGLAAELIVTASRSAPGDRLEFSLNGKVVPSGQIKVTWNKTGREAQYGRPLQPCLTFMFRLDSLPTKFGDNQLGAKVIALDEAGQGDIVIDELEVTVLPPPRS